MSPSPSCIASIRAHEGLRLKAYLCPTGHPTIGYGHAGPEVRLGQEITLSEAERLLAADVKTFATGVERALGGAPTTQNQFDAFVSLAYNIGMGNFTPSTAVRRHKGRDYKGAAQAITWWNKGTNPKTGLKEVIDGLVTRRAAEAALYLRP
ncbi:lysozyme (plasmid) [Roseomonas mucosa]|uniref:lysozyme n=1 Tax=Roseomonas mucosa TaxID=207340 RepID=UPI0030CE44BE